MTYTSIVERFGVRSEIKVQHYAEVYQLHLRVLEFADQFDFGEDFLIQIRWLFTEPAAEVQSLVLNLHDYFLSRFNNPAARQELISLIFDLVLLRKEIEECAIQGVTTSLYPDGELIGTA